MGALLLLVFEDGSQTAGEGVTTAGEQELLSAMVLMVWTTNLCMWLMMTMIERIKNLDQELVLFLQVLQRDVKNLNAKKRFLSNSVKNLPVNKERINCYRRCWNIVFSQLSLNKWISHNFY